MTRRRKATLCLCCLPALTALALGASGCARPAPASPASSAVAPPALRTASPERRALTRIVEQPGKIDAFEQTPIYAKIPGYVEQVHVEIGYLVKKGAPLADLWVPELVEERDYKRGLVAQAKIDVELSERFLDVARANAKTSESAVEEAKFSLVRSEAVLARWKSESLRMEDLARQKIIDTQSRDETFSQYRSASAARDEAEAKHRSATAYLSESQARAKKAETEIEAARNRQRLAEADERRVDALLAYSHITAPFDGVVSARKVDTKHFVQPATGPLFVVVRMDKVRVFVDVPESDAVLIKYGGTDCCQARIKVPVLNDREFVGNVVGSSWSLDPGQRTLRTEIDFDNADGFLRPNMYIYAAIEVRQPGAWMVPVSAFVTRDGLTYGFIVEYGKAVKTPVKVGGRDGDAVQVLKRQLPASKPGAPPRWVDVVGDEKFIIDNVGDLGDGQEVRVEIAVRPIDK
jgi:HlyD family secretion protein